jgi:hypothetical protein
MGVLAEGREGLLGAQLAAITQLSSDLIPEIPHS